MKLPWFCTVALVLAASVSFAQEERFIQPEGTLPEVVVEAQPAPTYAPSYNYPNSGGGLYPLGTIPWSSNAITSDNDLVGPYGQPQWTTQRPFSASRVYVLPPGMTTSPIQLGRKMPIRIMSK